MTPEEAMERVNLILAHAWMVRTFLKHADETQDHEQMQEVHRTIFDFARGVEGAYQRKDTQEYFRRLRGKLNRLRKAAQYFADDWRSVSTHTNYEMAARSLSGCLTQIDEIVALVTLAPAVSRDSDSEGEGVASEDVKDS
jgi:hypothetical protein